MDSGWYYGCVTEDPAIRSVWWQLGDDYEDPTIRVEFHGVLLDASQPNEDEFDSDAVGNKTLEVYEYSYLVPTSDVATTGGLLQTDEGLQPGLSASQLRQIYPDVTFYYIGDDIGSVNTWATEDYSGWISSDPTDPTAFVGSIIAGQPYAGIPC